MEAQEAHIQSPEFKSSLDYTKLLAEAKAEHQAVSESTPEAVTYDPRAHVQELISRERISEFGGDSVRRLEASLAAKSPAPDREEVLAGEHRQLLEGLKQQAEMRKAVSRIAIRLNPSIAEKILIDRESYKPLAKSKMTNALPESRVGLLEEYAKNRAEIETKHGMKRSDSEPSVVYGFLEETDNLAARSQAGAYGEAEIILKPEVQERSTFNNGDSLNEGYHPIDFDEAVYTRQLKEAAIQSAKTYMGQEPFVEAEIFGGVGPQDIEQVIITRPEIALIQDAEGGVIRDDLPEVFHQADRLLAAAPDVKLMLRLDVTNTFNRKAMLEFANSHPQVEMVLYVEAGSPFVRSNFDRRDEHERGPEHTSESPRIDVSREMREQEEARARLRQAETNLISYQTEQVGKDSLPANLSFTVAVKRYG